jgi:hypothetical protein
MNLSPLLVLKRSVTNNQTQREAWVKVTTWTVNKAYFALTIARVCSTITLKSSGK